ncbi:PadR family transcriptional regulator [Marinobacter sp. ATCH36]|uniref:PadR family transcriptional regulator n=1 Tax=Marinobacter sp. ATCH36 TaxID=2945106 RepID=UPI00202247B3|nr:PadR family transcriptional regulator [Marinobacter sp. ATCH36]MCL7943781.1 PadR family transcriptional regulator [Marinobacter sp. ATCH36]
MALKYALLCSLHESSATGYELTQRFRERMGNVWNASHQQIYRELGKLLDAGLLEVETVHQTDRPDRKLYRINAAGETALAEWVNLPAKRPAVRDPMLLKMFAGDLMDPNAFSRELVRNRVEWERQLAEYRAIEEEFFSHPQQLPRHYQLQYLALRRGIMGLQTWLAWAGEVEEAL